VTGIYDMREIPDDLKRYFVRAEIGLEETPEQYVANLVAVFREVRRVLRDDGTVWLNLGDSYAGPRSGETASRDMPGQWGKRLATDKQLRRSTTVAGYKPKDLLGIPWLVAFALRADGWYLRSDIIWAKPNPMPESVTDRPTKAHEYLFLLSKSRSYFYDADAIREPHAEFLSTTGKPAPRSKYPDGRMPSESRGEGYLQPHSQAKIATGDWKGFDPGPKNEAGRNKRSVWTVATQPFPGAHFATFPPKLIEPCVLAGSSPQACAECGAPWERVTERTPALKESPAPGSVKIEVTHGRSIRRGPGTTMSNSPAQRVSAAGETTGWQPTCDHSDGSARCTVLDPFSGAGTTGVVALRHDRDFIGIELNPSYAQMARNRIYDDGPLLNTMLGEDAA
jgi:DNA modification methylase